MSNVPETTHQLLVEQMLAQAYYLTYTSDGSNKYWGALPDSGQYIIVWGAIGRPCQSQKVSPTIFRQRLNEKKAKGYTLANHDAPYNSWLENPNKYFGRLNLSSNLLSAIERLYLENHTPQSPVQPQKKKILKRL